MRSFVSACALQCSYPYTSMPFGLVIQKVPDLKAELQRRGAKVSGTKQELVDRLEE